MPIYEYRCDRCDNRFEMMRPMARFDEDAPCPECSEPAKRALSVFSAASRSGADSGSAAPPGGSGGACSAGFT